MSVIDRSPEANFCWKFSESIMTRGCFDGLFLQGVARQVTGTGAVMVGEVGVNADRVFQLKPSGLSSGIRNAAG